MARKLMYTVEARTDGAWGTVLARFCFFDHAERFALDLLARSDTIDRTRVLRYGHTESCFGIPLFGRTEPIPDNRAPHSLL